MRRGGKGCASGKKFFNVWEISSRARKLSVEQVLAPPLVAMADEPHELPRRMQREGPRPPRQPQPRLFRSPVALRVVAQIAARHQVFPRGASASRTGHHVIERKFGVGKHTSAKLACVPVA